jgi:serine/threonine-protein kinase
MSSLPRVGTEFAGYRIEGVLGRGGMSVVYRAVNPRLGTAVALKLLAPELAEQERFRERFVRESRQAAALNHPNVVTIYDAGDHDGVLFIAMRLVEGSDLKELLRREGPLALGRALGLVRQTASALDAAHARGLIHRDVKPGNILIESASDPELPEHVYLADFGLTKHVDSTSGLTASGAFVGTIDYMAPEQIEGGEVDARTDVYSLGCVAFECLAGQPPFKKETDAAVLWAHMREDPPSVSALRPEVPAAVDEAIGGALAKAPDERLSSCRELVRELEAAAGRRADEPRPRRALPARPRPWVAPPRRPWRPHVAWPVLGLAALLLIGGPLAAVALRDGGERTVTVTSTVKSQAAAFSPADRVLLDYVPSSVRKTCEHGRVPTPDFIATVSCNPEGVAVRYNLARSAAAMNDLFRKRALGEGFSRRRGLLAPEGECGIGARSLRNWRVVPQAGHAELLSGSSRGAAKGSVLCYRQNGWGSIEWTDSRVDVYSVAFGNDLLQLYGWWKSRAGPSPPKLVPTAPPSPKAAPPPPPPPPPTIVVG